MANSYPHLFSPLRLRGVELRNRTVMTAHRKGLDMPLSPGPREVAYLAARARGGIGLLITEASPVHPTSFPHGEMNTPYDPTVIPRYRAAAEAVHEHGAAIFGQVYHCGAEAVNGMYSDLPLWAPSEMRGLGSEELAHAMTRAEIHELVDAFARAATNFTTAGFDGVEIHAGHGYLIEQFFSPLTNQRTDEYGGSLANRVRFAHEVVEAVRGAVGKDVPVGLRVSADERLEGGLTVPDMVEICADVTAAGRLDYLSVSNGTHESYAGLVSTAASGMGALADYAAAVKPHVEIPVLAVGRLHTGEAAEAVLAAGKADLVGMLRAVIADPEAPNKFAAGEDADVRPCIAVNHCLKRVHLSAEIRCAVNPWTGRENEPLPEVEPTRVSVVGAGPGGLEAACAAAELGHQVTLYEREQELGGAFAIAGTFPNKIGSARLLDFYLRRLDHFGVDVRLGVTIEGIADLEDPGEVIVATGAESLRSPWHDRHPRYREACDDPRIFRDSWRGLQSMELAGKHVIVVESEMADYVAATLCGYLATTGARISVVTSYPTLGSGLDRPSAHTLSAAMAGAAATVFTNSWLDVRDSGLVVCSRSLNREFPMDEVDLILATGPRRSCVPTKLADGSAAELVRVQTVGDCVAPRGIAQAIQEASRAVLRVGAH
jgi:2,4-dienoyl-CoA reductase-like NADH-dependent reductase (Old Yellow Enzyme family)